LLAARRSAAMPHPGQWEFPGGKVRPGETDEAALARELAEELGLTSLRVRARLPVVRRRAAGRRLALVPLVCAIPAGAVRPREHDRVRWVRPAEAGRFDWLEPDLAVLAHYRRRAPRGRARSLRARRSVSSHVQ
jgi:8-oxo-dGTP diphosphatase